MNDATQDCAWHHFFRDAVSDGVVASDAVANGVVAGNAGANVPGAPGALLYTRLETRMAHAAAPGGNEATC